MAASPIGTHPDDMGEGVSETKSDRNERNYEGKEAKCPDVTCSDDKEKGLSEEKVRNNKRNYYEKEANAQM